MIDLRPPLEPPTRDLPCTRCGVLIGLWEAPEGHTDPETFRCIECLGGDPHERAAQ